MKEGKDDRMNEENDIEKWKESGGHPLRWMPFELYEVELEGADGAVDTLQTVAGPPHFIYKVTNISAWDKTTQVSAHIAIGYVSGGVFRILKAAKPAAALTVDWQGEIYLKEGDRIRAVFTNTTSGDDIYLVVNGLRSPIKD